MAVCAVVPSSDGCVHPAHTATPGSRCRCTVPFVPRDMLDGAYNYLESAPWLWIFPGMLIVLTVMSINFLGDGLRDALDPTSRL